jgi:hypothetical protein
MWSFGIQREILPKTVFSVDYIGRRAYHLIGAYNANQTEIFKNGFLDAFKTAQGGGESALLDRITSADTRRNANESGAAFLRRSFSSELKLNSVGAVANSLARRIQGGRSALDIAGVSPYFFFPYPQFGAGVRVIDSNDFSTYHGSPRRLNTASPEAWRAVQLHALEVARHPLLRSGVYRGRHGVQPDGRIHAVR